MDYYDVKESYDRTASGLERWEDWFLVQTARTDLQIKIKNAINDLREVSQQIHNAKINALERL